MPYRNGFALAGLVVAVVAGLVLALPLVWVTAWILAPAGLVLGCSGLLEAAVNRGVGLVNALGAVVLSLAALFVCLILAVT